MKSGIRWLDFCTMIIFLTYAYIQQPQNMKSSSVVVIDMKVRPPLKLKTLLELTRRRSSDLIPFLNSSTIDERGRWCLKVGGAGPS